MPPSGSGRSKSGPSQQGHKGEKPKGTTDSTPAAPRKVPIRSEQGESSRQTPASAPVGPKNTSAQPPAPRQRKPRLPKPLPRVSTKPQLSTRQMQDLLRGNRGNRVSVEVENVYVCSILRPVAKHFSPKWRQELANIHVTSVHVTLPATSPPRNAPTAPAGNAPESSITAPAADQEDSSPTPSDKNAVTFIVQWMEQGGADPVGPNALVYPRGNQEELTNLRGIVKSLGVDQLVARTIQDLAALQAHLAALQAKQCTRCREYGHPNRSCVFCVFCKQRTHLVEECFAAAENRRKNLEWEQNRAQREKEREERRVWEERRKAEREREAKRQEEIRLRRGELAVDGNDQTIPTFRSRPNM